MFDFFVFIFVERICAPQCTSMLVVAPNCGNPSLFSVMSRKTEKNPRTLRVTDLSHVRVGVITCYGWGLCVGEREEVGAAPGFCAGRSIGPRSTDRRAQDGEALGFLTVKTIILLRCGLRKKCERKDCVATPPEESTKTLTWRCVVLFSYFCKETKTHILMVPDVLLGVLLRVLLFCIDNPLGCSMFQVLVTGCCFKAGSAAIT